MVDQGPAAVKKHLASYAKYKREYLETAKVCDTQQLAFVPLVVDAHAGGWDEAVEDLLLNASARLTSSYRRVQSGPVLTPKEWLSQRLSVTIQLSTTRATLRRLAGGLDSFQ